MKQGQHSIHLAHLHQDAFCTEICHLIQEFQCNLLIQPEKKCHHNEQYNSFQFTFSAKFQTLYNALKEFENSFLENVQDVLVIECRATVDKEINTPVYSTESPRIITWLKILEKLVILLHCSTSNSSSITGSKQKLFVINHRPLKHLPRIKVELQQHVLRNDFQDTLRTHLGTIKREVQPPCPNEW